MEGGFRMLKLNGIIEFPDTDKAISLTEEEIRFLTSVLESCPQRVARDILLKLAEPEDGKG